MGGWVCEAYRFIHSSFFGGTSNATGARHDAVRRGAMLCARKFNGVLLRLY